MKKRKVLLTARAIGAAWGILEIWRAAAEEEDLEVTLVSQEPASSLFRKYNIPFVHFDLPPARELASHEAEALFIATEKLLSDLEPDVAFVGLSTPEDGGIDEAVIYCAECPTFMVQDFWGDSNLIFLKHPNFYLAMDREAAEQTLKRHSREGLIFGSPRHVSYEDKNFSELRAEALHSLGLHEDEVIHGFLCQPLSQYAAYFETVRKWASALKQIGQTTVIYRPHPSSSAEQKNEILGIFRSCDLTVKIAGDLVIDSAITACSTVSSVLSNSMVDAAYINHYSNEPMAAPIYLLFEPEIVKSMSVFFDADNLPTVKQGLAYVVRKPEDLGPILDTAGNEKSRRVIWQNAKKLPDPKTSLKMAVGLMKDPKSAKSHPHFFEP